MRLACARTVVFALVAAVVSLSLSLRAASASALSISGVTVTPEVSSGPLPPSGPAAAGAHPDLVTRIDFDSQGTYTADTAKNLQIHFAPGIVAFVNHVGRCTLAQFAPDDTGASSCPADSAVGTVVTGITTDNPVLNLLLGGSVSGTIYNLEAPDPGHPAAFGIDIAPPLANPHIKVVAPISVDPHDLGLTASLTLPSTAATTLGTVNVHTDYIEQILNGYVGTSSFFTNPTSCTAAPVTVNATSYSGAGGSGSGSYTPTDCANVPFSTSLQVGANPSSTDSTSEISFDVKPGADDVPRATSMVKAESVIAPPGVLLNSALAARLDACTDAGFALADTAVPASCPPSAKVGSIDFTSPILGNFPGTVYFGTSAPNDLLRLFLDVPLFGAHIKISAHVRPDPTTGQITTIFDRVPQVAFTDFRLTFSGGPQSALVTPTTCGTNVAKAIVTPWSGGADATAQGSFDTSGDGHGGPCARTFSPSISASVGTAQAGASTALTLGIDRPDRTVALKRINVALPPGLVGKLALPGLTQCPLAQVAKADCPASSRIGSVQSVVGSGSEPPTLAGSVYLAAPKVAGDPASLAVVVPAKLGPVDAGVVIVGVRLVLRSDGGLDVHSDDIPALQQGIPLAIRHLTITLDRPGFMRNPSSCGAKTIAASFDALDGGPGANATTQLRFIGCDALPFAPRLTTMLSGKGQLRAGGHPAFTTVITQKPGEAAISSARVTLPRALATNIVALRSACTPAQLQAGRCPATSRVATATAASPLISRPLAGPVYLVSQPNALPKLVVQLRGQASIDLDGTISIANSALIVTTFGGLPDLSLTRFRLAFRSGHYGVLSATRSLCAVPVEIAARFVSHSGRTTSQTSAATVVGCPRTTPAVRASLRFRGGSGRMALRVTKASGASPLAAVRIVLPRGLRLDATARRTVVAKAGTERLRGRAVRVGAGAIVLSLGRHGAGTVTVSIRGVRATSRALARKLAARKARLTVRAGTRDARRQRVTVRARLTLR